MPPDVIPEPLLTRRQQHLMRLERVSAALQHDGPRPSKHTHKALLSMQAMLRAEIRRLEAAWLDQGPSKN